MSTKGFNVVSCIDSLQLRFSTLTLSSYGYVAWSHDISVKWGIGLSMII